MIIVSDHSQCLSLQLLTCVLAGDFLDDKNLQFKLLLLHNQCRIRICSYLCASIHMIRYKINWQNIFLFLKKVYMKGHDFWEMAKVKFFKLQKSFFNGNILSEKIDIASSPFFWNIFGHFQRNGCMLKQNNTLSSSWKPFGNKDFKKHLLSTWSMCLWHYALRISQLCTHCILFFSVLDRKKERKKLVWMDNIRVENQKCSFLCVAAHCKIWVSFCEWKMSFDAQMLTTFIWKSTC